MKHSLQIRQSRRLQLNAQLTQSLRLLQLGRVDLDLEIQNKLETNPLLEGVDSLIIQMTQRLLKKKLNP